MTLAASKAVGESVQELTIETVDELQPAEVPADWGYSDDDFWYDAVTATALFASDAVPMVGICVVERDTPVEIKAALATISDGSHSRRGRFTLRRDQHERLLESNGVYCFVVYEPGDEDDTEELLGLLVVPAFEIEDIRSTWYEPSGRADYWQLSLARLPIDVDTDGGEEC